MTSPKILFIDIETSPQIGYSWSSYDTNILGVIEPVKIICGAWKYLNDKKVSVRAFCDYDDYTDEGVNDLKLVTELWSVVDSADIIIAHNADNFDLKVLNARFIANGLNAPSKYESIDTLKAAKKYFKFNNNTLNELGQYLGEGKKAATGGFETWVKCMAKDKPALDRMRKYNVQDIELLERVYLRLRPFIGNHPNLNVISPQKVKGSEFSCGSCLSTRTQKRGFSVTKSGRYQRWQCQDCGSWSNGPYERVSKYTDLVITE